MPGGAARSALCPALDALAVGIAGTSFCVAVHLRARRVVRDGSRRPTARRPARPIADLADRTRIAQRCATSGLDELFPGAGRRVPWGRPVRGTMRPPRVDKPRPVFFEKGAFGMSQMNQGRGRARDRRGIPAVPGQMTAVMRAMQQATGPKVLRIGLVAAGRILEERIVKQRTSVTVGPSEKSMFVVQANAAAAVQALRAHRRRLLPELPRRHDRSRGARERHHRSGRAEGPGEASRSGLPDPADRGGARQDRHRRDDVPLPVRRAAAGSAATRSCRCRSRAASPARSTGT